MKKYLVKNREDWILNKKEIAGINVGRFDVPNPTEFPCIAIRGYGGGGWDDVDFVYLTDFQE